jgi:hypothetical protein
LADLGPQQELVLATGKVRILAPDLVFEQVRLKLQGRALA